MTGPPAPAYRRSHHAQPWQATSAAAWVGEVPRDDDPLLGFAPFIHPQPKRTSITPDLQRRFVAVLAATGIVAQAARSIGKSMEALYMLRKRPGAEGFAAAWDEAAGWGLDRLEDCALERALSQCDYSGFASGEAGRGDALLMHVLRHRSGYRVDVRDLAPGHPVYERIRAEVLAEAGLAS
jgi:hypothetical protein